MKTKLPPSRHEPAGKRVVSAPATWVTRVGLGLGIAYNTPWYVYRQVAGVVWDCPECGGEGSVVLRRRRRLTYWFFCTRCRTRLYIFDPPDPEALAADLVASSAAL